jgi:cellulose synthase/poly-beta-1,6-N-acetylglucosamine synthase-like glycosyltransferase
MKICVEAEGQRGQSVTDISVFIPVYRESDQVFSMLDKLSSQDADKEILVTVDEPTSAFLEKSKIFSFAKFFFNKERMGKANALNEVAKTATGRVFLFLDADVEIPDDSEFLTKILQKMKYTDVLDIKKKVNGNSFLSKMTYYEYFTFNASSWLASKYLGKCPAVNGAAFAMRKETFDSVKGFRKVVAEDIDIATRAFLKNNSFAYSNDVEVRNHVYSDWRTWFKQRRRWAIGQAMWLRDWYKDLARVCLHKPQVILPGLFFLYPSVIALFLNVAVPSAWMYQGIWVFSFFLSVKFNIALPIFLMSLGMAGLLKGMIISLASFCVTAAIFFGFSRKLGFKIKLHELFVYYFFYSVLWLAIMTLGFVQVIGFKKKVAPDWKT